MFSFDPFVEFSHSRVVLSGGLGALAEDPSGLPTREIRDAHKTRDFSSLHTQIPETTPTDGSIYDARTKGHTVGGKTPAEVAGIEVKGENKWLTLIQNASRKR